MVARLNAEQRRALEILVDAGINGVTEATLLAQGFTACGARHLGAEGTGQGPAGDRYGRR